MITNEPDRARSSRRMTDARSQTAKPSIADAIAALNTQCSVDIPGLPTNPMTDFAAQNIANQMQRDRAQALAEAAGATRAAIDPTSPENPPSEC